MNQLDKMKAALGGNSADGVGYSVVANAMPASQAAAPYLGRTHVAGSVVQGDVIAEMVARDCPFGPETVSLVLNHTGLYLIGRMPKEPRSYDLVFAKVRPSIGGTFASADAPFDEKENELYVTAVPSEAIRTALAKGAPSRDDGDAARLAIKNVHGPADNTIRSGEAFDILGTGLTLGEGDEHAELVLPKSGGTVEVSLEEQISEDDGTQRIRGHLAHDVEACENARLKLWTHGVNPDSSLKEVTSTSLTVLAGETPSTAPTITKAYPTDHSDDGQYIREAEGFVIDGANFSGAEVAYQTSSGGAWSEATILDGDSDYTVNAGGTSIDVHRETVNGIITDADLGDNDHVKITISNDDGSASVERTVKLA